MLSPFRTKRGDTDTALSIQLMHGNGTPMDLTDIPLSSIILYRQDRQTKRVSSFPASAFDDVDSGKVTWFITYPMVQYVATYDCIVKVRRPTGEVQTFPVDENDPLVWIVGKDV